ncbi:MAG TPA: ATP-binding cassette domain-containing protein, partial [Isosphaeraceae bacterium]|nr:ATP-binding cassette domain-containing protein [Isosphaeraceae bacterium]
VVYLAMLLEPLNTLAASVAQAQDDLAGFDRVLDLLAEPCEVKADAATTEQPRSRPLRKESVVGRVSLLGVGFGYPLSGRQVLRDVTLTAEPGEVVALVGRSGAGKSTLGSLIARFYEPTQGIIRLDDVDLPTIDVKTYRRLLGVVEQDVFLFHGTVAENIAYAVPRATPSDVEHAARAAGVAEFIDTLPEGYETPVGERGLRLSGGQRQQLAIARAVLSDPKVLILDEATSHLDGVSEALVRQALASLMRGRTTFVIAHRAAMIRMAHRVILLEGGTVVTSGTHDDLAARSTLYREILGIE